ncbi:hypothetical protein EE612_045625 [Oryza sativa]|nr:hypothetical protein EE612_045625 [Oryza sativa]
MPLPTLTKVPLSFSRILFHANGLCAPPSRCPPATRVVVQRPLAAGMTTLGVHRHYASFVDPTYPAHVTAAPSLHRTRHSPAISLLLPL